MYIDVSLVFSKRAASKGQPRTQTAALPYAYTPTGTPTLLFSPPLSKRQGAWRKQVASPARNVTSPAAYNLGGPCVRGAKGKGSKKAPSPDSLVTTCAKHLETLNEIALTQILEGSPNGLAVEYRQLPEVRGGCGNGGRKLGKVVLWQKSTFWWCFFCIV